MKSARNTVHGDDFEGSAVWKKQTGTSKNGSKKASNNHWKLIPKHVKNTNNAETANEWLKNRLREPTFRPEGGFGSIFGSLERSQNRHCERKTNDRKKVRKTGAKEIASEGDAEAGKEGFGKDMDGKWVGKGQGSSTPSLIPRDGRADCWHDMVIRYLLIDILR